METLIKVVPTNGPKCGEITGEASSWITHSGGKREITVKCVDNNGTGCQKEIYSQIFSEDLKVGYIEIRDKANNPTACEVDVYIDTKAPSKPVITNPYNNKWINKDYTIKATSSDVTSGIAYFEYRYPNSSVAAEKNWTKIGNKGDTTISLKQTKERDVTLEVRACDVAGNCSETSSTVIRLDKTKPANVQITNSHDNAWTNTPYSIICKSHDAVSGVSYYQYRYPNSSVASEKNWVSYANSAMDTFTTTNFSKERNEIVQIRVCDKAGNCSDSSSSTIKIDKTAPEKVQIKNNYENVWTSTSYSVVCKSHDALSGISYYQYRYPNSSVASEKNWVSYANSAMDTFTTTKFTKERDEIVQIRACDRAGNCSAAGESRIKISKVFNITLNSSGASYAGTKMIYLKSGVGVCLDSNCNSKMSSSANKIDLPRRLGYSFSGYYTSGGSQLINANGYITDNFTSNTFSANTTLYAKWVSGVTCNDLNGKVKCNNLAANSDYLINYTGNCSYICDDSTKGNWRIKFLTSGTLTTNLEIKTDVFLVGGGGNAGVYYSGGGGGYTRTYSGHVITPGSYDIVIGKATKSSTAFGYEAKGGGNGSYAGYNIGYGGNGGSGGGGGLLGGNPGTDGANGPGDRGGKGQGTTTREFGEADGALYASGGSGYTYKKGTPNTGNGGSSDGTGNVGYGSSGIVIIRNYRNTLYNILRDNFAYSGSNEIVIEDDTNWKIRFYTSGTLTVKQRTVVDIFLVGGGGAAGSYYSGGGGGYTLTKKNITLEPGNYNFVVGKGASAMTNPTNSPQAESTSALGLVAAGGYSGGYGGYNLGFGGNGGSGGGGGLLGGTGASDGGDAPNSNGGKGQGTTTREFGEATGALYASGGSGYAQENGAPRTGNGGSRNSTTEGGAGGSGIIIIRNKR